MKGERLILGGNGLYGCFLYTWYVMEVGWNVKFAGTLQWTVNTWLNPLTKGGGKKKRFEYCLNPPSSNKILCIRAITTSGTPSKCTPLFKVD